MGKIKIAGLGVRSEDDLSDLVENRTSYTFEHCELNVFETFQKATQVKLSFDQFVFSSMITGKKIMRIKDGDHFEYLPGESVIVSPGDLIEIDFPEAQLHNPTQCLALEISNDVLVNTVDQLREFYPKEKNWGDWEINGDIFHVVNDRELADTINRIVRITTSNHGKIKDLMIELTLKEMIVRLMQSQARKVIESAYESITSSNPLALVIQYIKSNLNRRIDLKKLSDQACMSRANFFKKFKESYGISPSQFITKERIKLAKKKLQNPSVSITDVCYSCGFENLSHFTRTFRNETGISPKMFQLNIRNKNML